MTKLVYVIAHKEHDDWMNEYGYNIYYHAGMTNGVFDTTFDVTKAVRFNSKDELFEFLKGYCYFDGVIVREFTEEYLERIKDDENIKKRLCNINSL
jgi:hypothetical protein